MFGDRSISVIMVSSSMSIDTDIQVEVLSEVTKDYVPATYTTEDPTLPNFLSLVQSGESKEVDLIAYLDQVKPLSEPKWVRTGEINDFLQTVFLKKPAGMLTWRDKIEVMDPDPVR